MATVLSGMQRVAKLRVLQSPSVAGQAVRTVAAGNWMSIKRIACWCKRTKSAVGEVVLRRDRVGRIEEQTREEGDGRQRAEAGEQSGPTRLRQTATQTSSTSGYTGSR